MLEKTPHVSEWTLWKNKLVYLLEGVERASIEMLDLNTKETTSIAVLPTGLRTYWGLDVSPDGKWIVFTRFDESQIDIMLVEDFMSAIPC